MSMNFSFKMCVMTNYSIGGNEKTHFRSVKIIFPAVFYIVAAKRENLKSLGICNKCSASRNSVDPGVTIFVHPYTTTK